MTEPNEPPRLPVWTCHKTVEAMEIGHVELMADGSAVLEPAEAGLPSITVGKAYMRRHAPHQGGFYVRYVDGYESFSPAVAFREGYSRMQP